MNIPFPHRYEVTLKGEDGPRGLLSAGPRPVLAGGPPPEFGGDETRWSPEHLLLASAGLCLMSTFAAVARKSQLDYSGYESVVEGTLDKTPEGVRFTRVLIKASVRAADAEKATRLMELAKKHCLISNSLRLPAELEARILPA